MDFDTYNFGCDMDVDDLLLRFEDYYDPGFDFEANYAWFNSDRVNDEWLVEYDTVLC